MLINVIEKSILWGQYSENLQILTTRKSKRKDVFFVKITWSMCHPFYSVFQKKGYPGIEKPSDCLANGSHFFIYTKRHFYTRCWIWLPSSAIQVKTWWRRRHQSTNTIFVAVIWISTSIIWWCTAVRYVTNMEEVLVDHLQHLSDAVRMLAFVFFLCFSRVSYFGLMSFSPLGLQ